jgi:hypothetical protein
MARLRDPDSWFFLANEGPVSVGMACVEPLRGEGGTGPVIPGGCFLNFLFVVPERWGEESEASSWTLFSLRRSGGATCGFTFGRMKTTSGRTAYT